MPFPSLLWGQKMLHRIGNRWKRRWTDKGFQEWLYYGICVGKEKCCIFGTKCWCECEKELMYNTNGFRIEIMYDYYIVMKSMFLVVKLSFHPSIGYVSLTILLPWITHKQHQNYSKSKAFQNQNFKSQKLCIHIITLYKMKVFLKVINTSLYTNQKETNQKTS